jgi:predicted DNA-binding ribbon-helix-helix protein
MQQNKSHIVKRSVSIGDHKTSVSIEDAFWDALKEIAAKQSVLLGQLVSTINTDRNNRQQSNLSSAIRLFVLDHYRAQADARRPAEGPIENGHPVRSGRP